MGSDSETSVVYDDDLLEIIADMLDLSICIKVFFEGLDPDDYSYERRQAAAKMIGLAATSVLTVTRSRALGQALPRRARSLQNYRKIFLTPAKPP
ncbi:MAG: hypothetical protein LBC59_09630 [Chitinispirillales bacterium]|jgi:hypothetical protein|nr:hypothetical protein [Chitinispirillales bacterium]